jgi:CBS domain-containing protein
MHGKHATRHLRRPRLSLIIKAIGASTERAGSSAAHRRSGRRFLLATPVHGPSVATEGAMTVKAILSRKGTDVLTIEPTATLAAAVKLLADRKIGAVVITGADRQVIGILSERDIVRAFAASGPAALDEQVGQAMTRKVMTCDEAETVASLMERMTQGKFRHLPVVERGRLAGIVSIGDVVKYRLEEVEKESSALREYILTA